MKPESRTAKYPTAQEVELLCNRIHNLLPENNREKLPPWIRDRLNEVIKYLSLAQTESVVLKELRNDT